MSAAPPGGVSPLPVASGQLVTHALPVFLEAVAGRAAFAGISPRPAGRKALGAGRRQLDALTTVSTTRAVGSTFLPAAGSCLTTRQFTGRSTTPAPFGSAEE